MVTVAPRRIEHVPSLLIGVMSQEGTLPQAPPAVKALWKRPWQRQPTVDDLIALSWVAEWSRYPAVAPFKPLGIAGYRDVYDNHTNSDVREVIHIAGTARACIGMTRFLGLEAHAQKRRLIAAIDFENHAMAQLLSRMGYVPKRVVFEDLTWAG